MCNNVGWDIVSDVKENDITLKPHKCKILGNCHSPKKSLREAATSLAELCDIYELHDLAKLWRTGTHPDYLYYQNTLPNGPQSNKVWYTIGVSIVAIIFTYWLLMT